MASIPHDTITALDRSTEVVAFDEHPLEPDLARDAACVRARLDALGTP